MLTFSESACGMPLGISTGDVGALQMTASSTQSPHWTHRGRLHSEGIWCAQTTDATPTFTVCIYI